MQTATWSKPQDEAWYSLVPDSYQVVPIDLFGAFLIFDSNKKVIFVGWGKIRDHIQSAENDIRFKEFAPLYFTWTELKLSYYRPFYSYLVNQYNSVYLMYTPNKLDQSFPIELPF